MEELNFGGLSPFLYTVLPKKYCFLKVYFKPRFCQGQGIVNALLFFLNRTNLNIYYGMVYILTLLYEKVYGNNIFLPRSAVVKLPVLVNTWESFKSLSLKMLVKLMIPSIIRTISIHF